MRVAWPGAMDRSLIDALAFRGSQSASAVRPSDALFVRADQHGLAGVLADAWSPGGAPSDVHDVARRLAHEAHLALLGEIDDALLAAGVEGVLLKGAVLAERLYRRPWTRPTSDVDLLVREDALDHARAALRALGYVWEDSPIEARFRREHHHLHLYRAASLPIELHFHAYKGFGRVLRSEPLLERKVALPASIGAKPWRALFGLAAPDELVYLAAHAAAHRFERLGWLYDLKLLAESMSVTDLRLARSRAEDTGFLRVTALASELLVSTMAVPAGKLSMFRRDLGPGRRAVIARMLAEPSGPVARSATRFVYTASLCDSPASAVRYVRASTRDHVGRLLRRAP